MFALACRQGSDGQNKLTVSPASIITAMFRKSEPFAVHDQDSGFMNQHATGQKDLASDDPGQKDQHHGDGKDDVLTHHSHDPSAQIYGLHYFVHVMGLSQKQGWDSPGFCLSDV
jgi:hypothetical protein